MLDRFFVMPETVDRIRSSWIGECVERYVAWMTEHRINYYRRLEKRSLFSFSLAESAA